MKKALVLMFCFFSVLFAFLLTKPSGDFLTKKEVVPVESESQEKLKQLEQSEAPQPILIDKIIDFEKINDLKLKAFAMRKASFLKNKAVYFEWKGHKEDKMTGKEDHENKTYYITYKKVMNYGDAAKDWEKNQIIHKQIFIIPKNYVYKINVEGN